MSPDLPDHILIVGGGVFGCTSYLLLISITRIKKH